ncbi:MAG: hypothetical protein VZS44_07965 [Bacilli bacterium]|nr:hypothetical protein [Bacilli bacterium]
MNKHISTRYILEKSRPITRLMAIVEDNSNNGDSDNLSERLDDYTKKEFAFACAVICKELDVNIPDV